MVINITRTYPIIMVSEDDCVFVRQKDNSAYSFGPNFSIWGTGFSSEKEIRDKIKDTYDRHGNYEFGILDTKGCVNIPKPPTKVEILSDEDLKLRSEICDDAEENPEVKSAYEIDNTEYDINCYAYNTSIRYKNGQVDFGLNIELDEFESVPISTIDKEISNKIESMFNRIVGNRGEFLGYDSGYASRGRKDPFVKIYGRINRHSEKDKTIRSIRDNEEEILDIYWSSSNLSPIRNVKLIEDENKINNEDAILVLKYTAELELLEDMDEKDIELARSVIRNIEEEYRVTVPWLGVVEYKKEFYHMAIGVNFTAE